MIGSLARRKSLRNYLFVTLLALPLLAVQCSTPPPVDGTTLVTTPSCGGTAGGPLAAVIGDSISTGTQSSYYCWFNTQVLNWRTVVRAHGGQTVRYFIDHGVFPEVAVSAARGVFVELGTNDIGGVNINGVPMATIKNDVETAIRGLNGRCIVWAGQNEQWQTTVSLGPGTTPLLYKTIAQAKEYNNYLKSLQSTYPNLHYGDYDALVRTNQVFRDSFNADGNRIHPSTEAGKTELGAWAAQQLKQFCG